MQQQHQQRSIKSYTMQGIIPHTLSIFCFFFKSHTRRQSTCLCLLPAGKRDRKIRDYLYDFFFKIFSCFTALQQLSKMIKDYKPFRFFLSIFHNLIFKLQLGWVGLCSNKCCMLWHVEVSESILVLEQKSTENDF